MYWVYVLWSKRLKKRYVGSTGNLSRRLYEHNHGGNKFTRGGIPWILIYSEEYAGQSEARRREQFLKCGSGRKWLDQAVDTKH